MTDRERHEPPASETGGADGSPPRSQKQPGQDLDPSPRGEAPAPAEPEPGQSPDQDIRPAGPKDMDIKPRGWSKTDQELDESFPASDPPGNY